MNKLLTLFALVLGVTGIALAESDTVRVLVWDNDAGEAVQERPSASMDKTKYSYYVWADYRDGEWNIYGQQWSSEPSPWKLNFLVNNEKYDGQDQRYPSVACSSGGNFVVVWQQRPVGTSDPWEIHGRLFDYLNNPLGLKFRIDQNTVASNEQPRVARNRITGWFIVVWEENSGTDYEIYARLYKNDGTAYSNALLINDDGTARPQRGPVVAYNDSGIVIAWGDYRSGSRYDIYARRYNRLLEPLGSSKIVNDETTPLYNHLYPSIARADSGYYTIVWEDYRETDVGITTPNIYCQRYYSDGHPQGQNFRVNSLSGIPNRRPSLAMDRNDAFVVTWEDSVNSSSLYQIRTRYYDWRGQGGTIWTVNRVNTNDQITPTACYYYGLLSIAWQDFSRREGKGDIFGQYYKVVTGVEVDTISPVGNNYRIDYNRSGGRKVWYHPKKNYNDPNTPLWNEDPIVEPDSIYIPTDSAFVRAILDRNIPRQAFFKVDDTDTLRANERQQGKLNSRDYDACVMDLGYAEDGSSAGAITDAQQDSLVAFADSGGALLCSGNDFGQMYNAATLFSKFGASYQGPGNPTSTGNIDSLLGQSGTFTRGMVFDFPFKQTADNSVDIINASASGSKLIFVSEGPAKVSYGRGVSYSAYWKGQRAPYPHRNVYLTFQLGALCSTGVHPNTVSELMRRILGFQGFNVEPEPIYDLKDSNYTGSTEGCAKLVWTAVSDDSLSDSTSVYRLKFRRYDSTRPDSGKMSSETAFSDSALTYYQTWAPAAPGIRQWKLFSGLPPGDTLIFALKAGDESNPRRWGTLGAQPRVVVTGDTLTPHTLRIGYTYGCVNDFVRSEQIDIRNSDTLFVTWDASYFYVGFNRCDWRTEGDLFIYIDTQAGGADSTIGNWNGETADTAALFDAGGVFKPDFCLVLDSLGSKCKLMWWNGSAWAESIATYSSLNYSLDSINNHTYAEMRVDFSKIGYTVGNVFRYQVLCQYENNEHTFNAFPLQNTIGKTKALTQYPYFYQVNNGLISGVSPRNVSAPLAVELTEFSCRSLDNTVLLTWCTESEIDNYAWLIDRSIMPEEGFLRIATIPASGNNSAGHTYTYIDRTVLPDKTYYYKLGDVDINGVITWHGPISVSTALSPVINQISLSHCSPNPFSDETTINYAIPTAGNVSLKVYDICGRLVRTLIDSYQERGRYPAVWKGDNNESKAVASGVYFYRLSTNDGSLIQKVILLR
ncbi:MAG: T9SS type A sorting domain-containing protein [Candidatus Edwardsbacteria bacterium]